MPDEIDELIARLKKQKQVRPRSVFSHFVGSDESRFDDFTHEQIKRFTAAKDKIQKSFDYKIMAHILNSAGIERFSDYQFDMVRLGIGHYGISAVDNKLLEEVCTLKTNILQIKHVPASKLSDTAEKVFWSATLSLVLFLLDMPMDWTDIWAIGTAKFG